MLYYIIATFSIKSSVCRPAAFLNEFPVTSIGMGAAWAGGDAGGGGMAHLRLGGVTMPIIAENLTVSYRRHPAVHHVSCTFAEGEAWAVFGPNGAGKSTLLKAVMGLVKPDTGAVRWENLSRRDIAYLPQAAELDLSQPMTVFELAALGLWYETGFWRGIAAPQRARVQAALVRVGLADMGGRMLAELSKGQLQRALIARMLVQDAKFLLLDEPFAAVDMTTTAALLNILQGALKEGKGLVVVVHDLAQVEAYFPKTLLLSREKIAAGATAQVLTEHNLALAQALPHHGAAAREWCLEESAVERSGSLNDTGGQHD